MEKGICKLCLKNKYLCTESHIISKFLYKIIYGKNNSLLFLNNNRSKLVYNGEYERNILCKDCDNTVIGKLENYFASFLYKKDLKSDIEIINNIRHIVIKDDKDYDYNKYKLFLISLLWRSSISSRLFFSKIDLSEEIKNDLRLKILNNDPGKPEEYPCFITMPPLNYTKEGSLAFNTLDMSTVSPEMIKDEKWQICKFIIQGMSIYFIISRPNEINVEPSVDKDKLLLKISTREEYFDLKRITMKMIKNQKDKI